MRVLKSGRLYALQVRSGVLTASGLLCVIVVPGTILKTAMAALAMAAALLVEHSFNRKFAQLMQAGSFTTSRTCRPPQVERPLARSVIRALSCRSRVAFWRLLWPVVVAIGLAPMTLIGGVLLVVIGALLIAEYYLLIAAAYSYAKSQKETSSQPAALQA